jgi:hypothetical protein
MIYRNEKLGYEFKYPKLYENPSGQYIKTKIIENNKLKIKGENPINGFSIEGRIGLSIIDSKGLNLTQFVDNELKNMEGIEIATKENLTIAGEKGIKITYRTKGMGRYGEDIYLLKDNQIYHFSCFAPYDDNVWRTIISTFRFIKKDTKDILEKVLDKAKGFELTLSEVREMILYTENREKAIEYFKEFGGFEKYNETERKIKKERYILFMESISDEEYEKVKKDERLIKIDLLISDPQLRNNYLVETIKLVHDLISYFYLFEKPNREEAIKNLKGKELEFIQSLTDDKYLKLRSTIFNDETLIQYIKSAITDPDNGRKKLEEFIYNNKDYRERIKKIISFISTR